MSAPVRPPLRAPESAAESRPDASAPKKFRSHQPERPAPAPRLASPAHLGDPRWTAELNKFLNREVIVEQAITGGADSSPAPRIVTYEGIVTAINHQHLSLVLMTEDEKIIIKHVTSIRRKRSHNSPPKGPGLCKRCGVEKEKALAGEGCPGAADPNTGHWFVDVAAEAKS